MLPLLILLAAAASLRSEAACVTRYCKQNYAAGNENNVFYDPSTYGGDIHPDPTRPLSSNRVFRDYVNSVRFCTGKWCNRGTFTCAARGTSSCYHVEHILDQNANDARIPAACAGCKSIPGNMIMAAGAWNMGLGGAARSSYGAAQAEKRQVYSASVVSRAYASVISCCTARIGSEAMREHLSGVFIVDPSNGTYANVTYDESCDVSEECNCDSDALCGCDCDYDDATSKLMDLSGLTAIFSATNLSVSMTNLVLLILALVLLLGVSGCLCYLCCKQRSAEQHPYRVLSQGPPAGQQAQLAVV